MELSSLKLLTFNVWGLKYIAKHRRARIEALVTRLLDPSEDYDVIALQELWCEEDWNLLDQKLSQLYPYRRWYKSGIITGPGLAILSKIPIRGSWLYRFPINGFPLAVHRGDWFVGKSVSVTTLSNNIVVLNSHMHAPYGHKNTYVTTRLCQAWDITKLINLLHKSGHHVILVGDLNCRPGSLPHKLLMLQTSLRDSWEVLKSETSLLLSNAEVSKLSPKDQIVLGGVTCDSQRNTWRKDRKLEEACRLDYALINPSWSVQDAYVRFVETVPEIECSYSDHFAYYVKLKIKAKQESETPDYDLEQKVAIYQEFLAELENYEKHLLPSHFNRHKYYFYLCIVSIVALATTSAALVSGWGVFVTILAVILALSGGLSGLFALVWWKSELRAIEEVRLEVKDTMHSVLVED